jgi:RNA polymerase sigma factor (TIGR02999 family)
VHILNVRRREDLLDGDDLRLPMGAGAFVQVQAINLERLRWAVGLQATALVNEAFLRLARTNPAAFNDRAHFMATAAKAMRQILINHAETKGTAKRGGNAGDRVHLDVAATLVEGNLAAADVLAIDAAITRLEALDARKAAVVEAKVFGGLTHQEIADSMGISLTTVESDWRMAKAWLAKELAP